MRPYISHIRYATLLVALMFFALRSSAQLSANFDADIKSGCSPLVVNFHDMSSGNPGQWTWTLGNGTTSFLQHPTTTYFIPGTYHVKLVVKNATGADSLIKSQFIVVHSNPVVAFDISDTAGCYPKTIQFTDKSLAGSGTITGRTWDFGDGNISSQTNPTHTYANAGVYSVTLKVVNSFGCQKTVAKSGIIKLQRPFTDFSFFSGTGCNVSTTIHFNNLSQNAIAYQWEFGDGSSSLLSSPSHTYPSAGTYNVKLVTIGANGCRDSVIKPVVIGLLEANFNYNQVCAGSEISFQNISSPTPVSANWDFGDGTTSTDINPVKKFMAAGNYQVRLISDFGGCKDTVTKNVIVHPIPSAGFTQTGEISKCAPNATVNFNAFQNGVSYEWSFGDGNTATIKNPTHTYTAYGQYTVTLIVTSAFGCTDTVVKTSLVKVLAPDITGIVGTFEGCAPYQASFSPIVSTVDPVVSWSWDLDDGAISSQENPSHFYANPGKYNVKLKITTAGGCIDTITYSGAIQISNKPTASFTASPLLTCAAGPVQFNNTSTGASHFFWNFYDGGFSSAENPTHQFGDTGIFSIMLIASSTGCKDTLIIEDYVRNDPPIGRFNVIQNCANPYEVQFRDSSIGGQTYLWNFGDGNTSTLKHPKHVYQHPGTYQVAFTVFHGPCSYLANGTVTIIDEHPRITVSDTAICRNETVIFGASNLNSANISAYHWDYGDSNSLDTAAAYAEYVYRYNGKYLTRLVTVDALGCLDTSNIATIDVFGAFAGFENQAGVCVNASVAFLDTSRADGTNPITKWTWTFGDGNTTQFSTAPFSHIYNTKGSYGIQLKVTDSFGCEDSVYRPAALIVADPAANFIPSDSIRCASNVVTFNNASDGHGLQYTWDFGDSNASTDVHPAHAYANEGEYMVRLDVVDQFGCSDFMIRKQVIANPVAKFIASDTFASCPPLLVNLTNQSSAYSQALWDFGDESSANFNNPSHYYIYPGTYQLKLRSVGFGNCVDSASKTIVIKGPTGSFSLSPATICTNASVSFTATSRHNTHFLWDFSDGNTTMTTDSLISHVYDVPGFYQPRLILIDTAGCEVPIGSPDTIKVLGVQARIGFDNTLFCDSALVQFRDSSVIHHDLPAHYRWNFGDGSSSNNPNPAHYYTKSGQYQTRLTITTTAGCVDSVTASSPVNIFRSPHIGISGDPSVCVNDTISFAGNIVQSDTALLEWRWNFANGQTSTQQNPSQSFDTDGPFNVTAIATNGHGCSDTATSAILVHPLPNVKAGTDTMICRGQTYTLQPTGAATYEWQNDVTLSCTDCATPVVNTLFDKVYYVSGTSTFGCKASDSITIKVLQPFTLSVNRDDTLCKGEAVQLIANGAARYNWYPSAGLSSATISNPLATPSATTNYMVVGNDIMNCFRDTGYVNIAVYPAPQFNIIDKVLNVPAGSEVKIATTSSADITRWKWYPAKDLSCVDCPQPILTARDNIVYKAEAKNDGGCATTDEVTISVICNDGNVFIPNTFSPNNDGMNDVFYPRGKGITSVRQMRIFNRWGELVYEKSNFTANDATAGWNGSFKGSILTPDVYVYIVDVVCYNSTVFTLKGNVTLIR